MASPRLFHMVPVATWRECVEQGAPYYPPTYEQDGFIHLTADPLLLLPVANHFYTASVGDWVVLVLDAAKLTAEVKYEPAAPVGDKSSKGLLSPADPDEQQQAQQAQQAAETEAPEAEQQEEAPLFPHLYGTIDFGAVLQELPMQRDEAGAFLGIEGL